MRSLRGPSTYLTVVVICMPVAWAQTFSGPSAGHWLLWSNSEGCSSTGGKQAGVRWGQVSSGLFVVNRQQPGQSYIEKVPLVKLRRRD